MKMNGKNKITMSDMVQINAHTWVDRRGRTDEQILVDIKSQYGPGISVIFPFSKNHANPKTPMSIELACQMSHLKADPVTPHPVKKAVKQIPVIGSSFAEVAQEAIRLVGMERAEMKYYGLEVR